MLLTRLHRPPVTEQHVIRKDLIQTFQEHQHLRLSLVSAPPGYGKSISVSQWLDDFEGPSAWLSLDQEHNDLKVFIRYWVTSLQTCFPDLLKPLLSTLGQPQLPSLLTMAKILVNDLDRIGQPFITVLDDFHHVESEEVHELLNIVLANPPGNLNMVVITRHDPPLHLNRMRMYGQLHEVRMKDLAFTLEEVIALNRSIGSQPLSDAWARKLLKLTNGWVSALCVLLKKIDLNTPASTGKTLPEREISDIGNYILEEFVNPLPEAFQDALYVSSILDSFNSDLLDHVLDAQAFNGKRIGGSSFLKALIDKNFFLIGKETNSGWFSYHSIFREVIQHHFRQRFSPEQQRAWFLRASHWFERQGQIETALHYALASKDFDRMAGIIRHFRLNLEHTGLYWMVEKWLERIPPNIILQIPELLLASMFSYRDRYQMEKMEMAVETLDVLLTDDGDEDRELSLYKGYLSLWVYGKPREALSHFDHARPFCTRHLTLFYALMFYEVTAYQMLGEKDMGLKKLRYQIEKPGNQHGLVVYHLKAIEIFTQLLCGSFHAAMKVARSYQYAVGHDNDLYSEAFGQYLVGNTAFQRFELDTARDYLEKTVALRHQFNYRLAIDCHLGLALVLAFQNEKEKAEQILRDTREFGDAWSHPGADHLIEACSARCKLYWGKTREALEWAEKYLGEPDLGEIHFFMEVPALTRARILLLAGKPNQVRTALEELHTLAQALRPIHNQYHLADLLVLQALGLYRTGRPERAIAVLEEALEGQYDEGAIRAFVEPGQEAAELLGRLKTRMEAVRQLQRILDQQPLQDQAKERYEAGLPQISMREQEILEFLSKGLRNKEIALELNIAPDTVKSHLHNMYVKLEVSNRVELLRKARQMQLFTPQ